MTCKICEFWAREGDFESGHHPTCPHASLAERLRGIQVKTAYEAAVRDDTVSVDKLIPVGKDFDRNWKPVAELRDPELSREEIKKSLQEFRAAGWTIMPSHDELKLDVGTAADADEPVIRDG
jgi:hypothetical protein